MSLARHRTAGVAVAALSASAILFLAGCGSPSAANIKLRKELQDRDETIADLKRQHTADQADIAAHSGPTTTSLSGDALSQLYTTHGLKLGRLTGGTNTDANKPGDDALKIEAAPTDDDGETLKAAGTFDITAYDLDKNGQQIGHWKFDEAASRANWVGSALLYSYVFTCPWQTVPMHSLVTVRVTFVDTLTGRKFSEQRQVHVNLATTQP